MSEAPSRDVAVSETERERLGSRALERAPSESEADSESEVFVRWVRHELRATRTTNSAPFAQCVSRLACSCAGPIAWLWLSVVGGRRHSCSLRVCLRESPAPEYG